MDARTRELIQQGSILRGLLVWVFGRPDNPLVTPVDRFVSVVSRLTMFLTVVVVAITFYEVVMRYLFRSPTLWVNELTLWLGSVIFLVAGAYTMQRRAHIRITAVYDIVPRSVRLVFDIVAVLVVVAYAAMMIGAGFDVAFDTLLRWERFGTFWNPPIPATVKPLVLVVTFLVAVQAVNNLLADWFGVGKGGADRERDPERNPERHPERRR